MSAMHAGVMTTSTETMYAQRVTLTLVREFETRHPFIFVPGKCLLFSLLCFLFFFNYTPMEVVSPVGMLVYTAVYTLAADGAVFDTPKN